MRDFRKSDFTVHSIIFRIHMNNRKNTKLAKYTKNYAIYYLSGETNGFKRNYVQLLFMRNIINYNLISITFFLL